MNLNQYVAFLKTLLPRGKIWSVSSGSNLEKLLQAMGDELVRIDGRASRDLLSELDPRETNELLSDWERICGLPDPCLGTAGTLEDRRNNIVTKLASRGGQSPAYFIAVAAAVGFVITITEFRQFRAGISKSGDALTNGPWAFAWQVNTATDTLTARFRAGRSRAGDPLSSSRAEALECVITRLKPAHTTVLFNYT
jgi:uncharacterized protein YmfQ (DUF2313 family)